MKVGKLLNWHSITYWISVSIILLVAFALNVLIWLFAAFMQRGIPL